MKPNQLSIIDYDGNHGVSFARNRALESVGEFDYTCFLDADDEFMVSKLSRQLQLMIKTDSLFSHTDYLLRETAGAATSSGVVSTQNMRSPYLAERIARFGCQIATPTVMIRTDVLSEVAQLDRNVKGLFPIGLAAGEDIIAWLRVLNVVKDAIVQISEPLTLVNANLLSAKNSSAAQEESKLALSKEIENLGLDITLVSKVSKPTRAKKQVWRRFVYLSKHRFLSILAKLPQARRAFDFLMSSKLFRSWFDWMTKF